MEAALPLELVEYDRSVEETGDVSNMSAEEYLSWVRCQANQLPNVKRVNVDTSGMNRQSKYMPQVEDILQCPVDCLPSDEWQREMLFSFSELRAKLDTLGSDPSTRDRKIAVPPMRDSDAWHRFCFASELGVVSTAALTSSDGNAVETTYTGTESASMDCDAGAEADINDSTVETQAHAFPTSSNESARAMMKRKRDLAYQLGITLVKKPDGRDTILSSSTQPAGEGEDSDNESAGEASLAEDAEVDAGVAQAWAAAERAMHWAGAVDVEPTTSVLLQFDQVLTQRLLGLQIDWLETRDLTAARGRWLYALLARLEKPLYREAAASIRQLYRRCCALRYALSQTSASIGAGTNDADAFQSQLALLNMLISICGSYFGQGEEYDAFNQALAIGDGGDGEDGNEENGEDGNDEEGDEEDWDEDGEEFEVEMEENGDVTSSAAQGWVAVPTAVVECCGGFVERSDTQPAVARVSINSSRPRSSSGAPRVGAGGKGMELEDGEEPDEGCDSAGAGAKKSRV